MADRRTFEDHLREQGESTEGKWSCPNCSRECRPFEIVDVSDEAGVEGTWACSQCLFTVKRLEQEAAEQEELEQLPPWERPLGLELKAQRSRLLDTWAWTLRPDSPLEQACQDAFLAWMQGLHRMTVDHEDPEAYAFPDPPALVYADAS